MSTGVRILEGDLHLVCDDKYCCSGDVFVRDGERVSELAQTLRELFATSTNDMGAIAIATDYGKKWGRVRITIERLDA